MEPSPFADFLSCSEHCPISQELEAVKAQAVSARKKAEKAVKAASDVRLFIPSCAPAPPPSHPANAPSASAAATRFLPSRPASARFPHNSQQVATSGALSADAFQYAEDAARSAWLAAEKELQLQAATAALRDAAKRAQEALLAQEAAFNDELAAERVKAAKAEEVAAKAMQALAEKEAEFARLLSEERAKADEALREAGRKAQEELEAKEAKFQMARP